MGKQEQGRALEEGNPPGPTEEEEREEEGGSLSCNKPLIRWIISLTLALHLLLFLILSLCRSSISAEHPRSIPMASLPEAQIRASFLLSRPLSEINASLVQLASELQDDVNIPNSQVAILSLSSLPTPNQTNITFGVLPQPLNDSLMLVHLSLLRETFAELFSKQLANLSLSRDRFGTAYDFQVVAFPGGITVVPRQSGTCLQVLVVLFNFTLHQSLTHINSEFIELKRQLSDGINLKANETLYIQLTNLHGSTMEPLVVVQTSVVSSLGLLLPTPRLKQLAHQIVASPKNLGLNHTLFGRVKQIRLSSYLGNTLQPDQGPISVPSPSPFPNPSQSPSLSPSLTPHTHKTTIPPNGPKHRKSPSRHPQENALSPSSHHHHHSHGYDPHSPLPPQAPSDHLHPSPNKLNPLQVAPHHGAPSVFPPMLLPLPLHHSQPSKPSLVAPPSLPVFPKTPSKMDAPHKGPSASNKP